ncbi:partial D-glycerate 2-kinase, partial [Methylococcales bacterium]
GRNTELCLAMARQLFGLPGFGVLCAASDGNDGITDAAGAWFNTDTLSKVTTIDEIDHYLHNNDSYSFFEKYDCLIKTGITNTNLNDVVVGWKTIE